ncbi:hypothetical protein [Nocardia nova]|uniref:hypothetical protein n=1 Tax=Nocardia nova TaxID=37330 RepID=UPI0011B09358
MTLDRLADVLSGYGVRMRLGAVARSIPLRSVVIHGPVTDPTEVGDVLLGIGARSPTTQWCLNCQRELPARDDYRPTHRQLFRRRFPAARNDHSCTAEKLASTRPPARVQ